MPVVTLTNLEDCVLAHLADHPADSYTDLRMAFEESGFALIPTVLPESIKSLIADEALLLAETRSVRRDLQTKETSFSNRKMRNVGSKEVLAHGGWIPAVYESQAFRGALSRVAAEPVRACPYMPERYIINRLDAVGDTHGWHWDDYSFAVIFVVECPPVGLGGFVQTVTDTSWDKTDPRVFETLVENPILSHVLSPGDIYLLRADTTLHQVHPILGGRRTIVNMVFAADRDFDKEITHETMEQLFGLPCSE